MLHFSILGPLEVHREGEEIRLGGQQQRSLLALLLLSANRVAPTDFLIDRLWGDEPPRTATTSLQNGILRLRRLLGAEMIERRPPGYVLHATTEQLDLARFEQLRRRARAEQPSERAETLREALGLVARRATRRPDLRALRRPGDPAAR
jgi:DNA-binding SARP family transcriptional activator